ncbi:MAG: hypothetical protein AB7D57_03380 [Desulfovibrionaceae bacterium]
MRVWWYSVEIYYCYVFYMLLGALWQLRKVGWEAWDGGWAAAFYGFQALLLLVARPRTARGRWLLAGLMLVDGWLGFGAIFSGDEPALAAVYRFGLCVFFTLGAVRLVTLRDVEIRTSDQDAF